MIALRMERGRATVHSTPFSGTLQRQFRRRAARLVLGLVLRKKLRAYLTELSPSSCLPQLLRCVALPIGDSCSERLAFATAIRALTTASWATCHFPLDAQRTVDVVRQSVGRGPGWGGSVRTALNRTLTPSHPRSEGEGGRTQRHRICVRQH